MPVISNRFRAMLRPRVRRTVRLRKVPVTRRALRRAARAFGALAVASCTTVPPRGSEASSVPPPPAPTVESAGPPGSPPAVVTEALQLLVVTTAGWDVTPGELRRYVRDTRAGTWRREGDAVPIVVGRTGLAWGTGFERAGPRKVEGDGRAPAGAFPLGTAFGFAPADSMRWVRLPYLPLTDGTECVDDPASMHYNQVVDRAAVRRVDWTSAEHMRRVEQYRLGIVVDYNTGPAVRGRGSCIFFHIWAGPGSSTVGCTAMDARELARLLAWIDPRRHPAVVQLPADVYRVVGGDWGLPVGN